MSAATVINASRQKRASTRPHERQSGQYIPGLNGGVASRPQRVKSGRPLYGEVGNVKDSTGRLKQTTRRFRASLDLSAFAKEPASTISRASRIRCATKMNPENERSGVKSVLLKAAALPERIVTNWRRRSSGLRRGLEGEICKADRMNRKTFSESFSEGVRNCSSKQCRSTLNLFGKSRNLEPKNGHEPPDSDLRLQSELRVQQRIKETQGPNGHQNGHQFSNP